MRHNKTLRILYFKIRGRIRSAVIRLWLRIPLVKAHWIDDAAGLLEAFTEDSDFANWYAVELYEAHMDNKYWSYYESGSDVAQEDMSYWSD